MSRPARSTGRRAVREAGVRRPEAPTFPPLHALERATGGRRVGGNRLALQFDGSSTFEVWLEAIAGARRVVYFENYIMRDDRAGRAFRDALVTKAREGIPVYVVYDWVGCWATPRRYWGSLRDAGVNLRAFNRPSIRDPFGVFQRDHRKLVCVDGEVAFVGGFCVGDEWAGRGDEAPWRDTGVEIHGPAAGRCGRAFERIWSELGDPVPEPLPAGDPADEREGTPVWIIEGEPRRSRVFRTLSLVAAHARRRLWITDPYFVAPRPVSEALAAAARDGVDVRVLVPAHNNWPFVGALTRGGFRSLLESGVRLFEWQGPMIHAKTVVADTVWSRVGSSNLNTASLLGNWEIDVGILDEEMAIQLEALFLADLASSVEIVLPSRRRAGPARAEPELRMESLDPQGTFSQRLERELRSGRVPQTGGLAALVRAGSVFGNAIAGHRPLGREDRTVLGTVAVLVLAIALVAGLFPWLVGWTVALVAAWLGIVLGVRAYIQARRARLVGGEASGGAVRGPRSNEDRERS